MQSLVPRVKSHGNLGQDKLTPTYGDQVEKNSPDILEWAQCTPAKVKPS